MAEMKTFDKAAWHIDGGENEEVVISRFKRVFKFLSENNMLNENGEETYLYCMDNSVTLNSTLVNDSARIFLEQYYDRALSKNSDNIDKVLQEFLLDTII